MDEVGRFCYVNGRVILEVVQGEENLVPKVVV